MAIYAVGRISGAHLNPAVTVGLASIGSFPWANVPGYIAAQMVGAFAGAALVWLTYLPHWAVTRGQGSEAGGLLHRPGDQEPGRERHHRNHRHRHAALRRAGHRRQRRRRSPVRVTSNLAVVFSRGLQPLLVGILVLGIGVSLGGPTGYAINPARDLGPRLAHAVLPIAGKRDSDWGYAWIPIVGPIIGGVLGALLFTRSGSSDGSDSRIATPALSDNGREPHG